jgi:hypothetical protein
MLYLVGKVHRCVELRNVFPIEQLDVAADVGNVNTHFVDALCKLLDRQGIVEVHRSSGVNREGHKFVITDVVRADL